jgi:predicted DNA-binding transcriptional regulator AlpA
MRDKVTEAQRHKAEKEKQMEKRILIGRKEIAGYVGRSWPTVERLVESKRFPAKKIEGVWMAKEDLIDFWLQERIEMADATTR